MVQPASSVNKYLRKIYREAPQKETVLFGTNGPNVGGWGRVVPNFYKSLFYDIFDHYIRSQKLCQSQVQISQNLWDGRVCSQVWANMRALEFFYWTHISSWIQFFMFGGGVGDQNSSSRNTEIVLCTKGSKQCIAMRQWVHWIQRAMMK